MIDSIILKITHYLDKLVSIVILLVALRLVLYMVTTLVTTFQEIATGDFWLEGHNGDILDWVVLYIVLVKAYKILVSYAKYHHVSIRYVTELVIIACFVEFIFEAHFTDTFRALLGGVGLGSLFLYLHFYETIKKFDRISK